MIVEKIFSKLNKYGFFGETKSGWSGDEILKRIINAILLGLFAIVLFAAAFTKLDFFKIISTALLLAGSAFISGAFLGFLFGIPRTNQGEEEAKAAGIEKNGV